MSNNLNKEQPIKNNSNNVDYGEEELSPPAKAFMAYIEFIYKVLDKAGVTGINMLGSFLELNVNGKKITEQSSEELFSGLKSLSEKLQDPRVKQALDIAIEELSPVVQKSAKKFVNLFIEVFKTGLISSVAVACEVPPLSVFCGMSKSASAFLDLAAKSMGMASSSIDDIKEAKEASKEITNVLSENPVNMSGLHVKTQIGGGDYILIGGKTLKNLSLIQSSGSQIEKRIDNSIKQFNNPLKYYKKTTGKIRKRRNKKILTKKYKK
jgi:hypothetical protein